MEQRTFTRSSGIILLLSFFFIPLSSWAIEKTVQKYMQDGYTYYNLELYEKAIESFGKVIEIEKNARAYAMIGFCYMKLKDPKNAIKYFEESLQLDPKNKVVALTLANLYIQNRKNKEATELLEKTINLYPNDREIIEKLANAYLNSKQYEKAIQFLEKQEDIEKDNKLRLVLAYSYYKYGQSLFYKGNKKEAKKFFQRSIELEPGYTNRVKAYFSKL